MYLYVDIRGHIVRVLDLFYITCSIVEARHGVDCISLVAVYGTSWESMGRGEQKLCGKEGDLCSPQLRRDSNVGNRDCYAEQTRVRHKFHRMNGLHWSRYGGETGNPGTQKVVPLYPKFCDDSSKCPMKRSRKLRSSLEAAPSNSRSSLPQSLLVGPQ